MITPAIIGHRGAAGHAPENTLESIRKAAELGVKWVEFDTMLSADNRVLLLHDEELDRTTATPGLAAETCWDDIEKLDAGSWFSPDYAAARVPLLLDVFKTLEELNLGAVIEIKPSTGRDEETARLSVELVKDFWPSSLPTPIISSFSVEALCTAQDLAPEFPRALNMWRSLAHWRSQMEELGCIALHCQHDILNKRQAAAIIDSGYDIRCFTVNNPRRAKALFQWGVHAIFTDFPDRFIPSPERLISR